MALQLSLVHPDTGFTFPSAYFRIELVEITRASVRVSVRAYAASWLKDRSWVHAREHMVSGVDFSTYFGDAVYTGGTTNPIKQAYLALKAMADYSGGIDV